MDVEANDLIFLPRPRTVERRPGAFRLDAATAIQVGERAGEATHHAARGLQTALAAQLGVQVQIVPTARPAMANTISLVLVGRDDAVFPAKAFGWQPPNVPDTVAHLGEQGYVIRIDEAGATVSSTGEAGLFYGVQKLIQLAKLHGRRWPALVIADAPALPVRGLLFDVSRGKVPTSETLTNLVVTLAHYGFNQLQLYTVHTFRFPSAPEVSAGAEPLTADDIIALDALCRAHHVELVPNFQSLGHHRRLLSLPQYSDLAETPWAWSFATVSEAGFALIDRLYGDLLPAFTSDQLNIGADEPWDLGLGQSRSLTEAEGVGRVYLRHVQRLHELAAKHGRRTMMWADVFWHHPELVGDVPEEILLLDWWYEVKERHETVEVIAAAGRRFYVCPGTASWISLYPRTETAFANIAGFVRDGLAAGAAGMLLTDWGDGGHYQLLSHNWYPYLWGAECGWSGATTPRDEFETAFGHLHLGEGSGRVVAALSRLGAAMQEHPEYRRTWNTPMALWEEPLAGRLREVASPETIAETKAAADALQPLIGLLPDPKVRADLGYTAAQIAFACDKVELTRALRAALTELAAMAAPTEEALARLDGLIAALRAQAARMPALIEEFETRWLSESRRAEIEINLDRFARLQARYEAALAWLAEQRAAFAGGRGIDGGLRTYETGGYAVLYQESIPDIRRLADLVGLENLPPDIQAWLASHG
jgi:hypothetical protein